jgi:hypothetical protein
MGGVQFGAVRLTFARGFLPLPPPKIVGSMQTAPHLKGIYPIYDILEPGHGLCCIPRLWTAPKTARVSRILTREWTDASRRAAKTSAKS